MDRERQAGPISRVVGLYQTVLRRSLELDPSFGRAHFNLGLALARSYRIEEAETHFRRFIDLEPDHASACTAVGVAYANLDRLELAIGCFRRAAAWLAKCLVPKGNSWRPPWKNFLVNEYKSPVNEIVPQGMRRSANKQKKRK